jgi:hypothetical protein
MQWANLPELHETPAFDDSDLDCLEEIRDVLAKRKKPLATNESPKKRPATSRDFPLPVTRAGKER